MKFYDIHSHILPGMDDGAKDVETSLKMLTAAKQQGCAGIVATSHYYRKESIGSFLERRDEAYGKLMAALTEADPFWKGRIVLGAEAAYYQGLFQDPDLEKLCFGRSRWFLLEMPFEPWTPALLRDVNGLIANGYQVLIAHLERYRAYAEQTMIDRLLEMDVMVQMDAEELLQGWSTRRKAEKMIISGSVDTLGSDCHNVTNRPPNMGPAIARLKNGRAAGELERILKNNEKIFSDASNG